MPQDFLSNVFQSVAGSLQQRLSSGGQQPAQPGRIVVEGPPGGPVSWIRLLAYFGATSRYREYNMSLFKIFSKVFCVKWIAI